MALPPRPWPTGLSDELEPLVRRVLAPNGSPYTFTGTQTYLVGRSQDAAAPIAVIDPGPDDEAHMQALIAAIGQSPVAAICCTHTHHDHSQSARRLSGLTGAPVIGCAALTVLSDTPHAEAPFDHDYRPDRVLNDTEQLSGPGWTLTAIATPGHTSNHLCYALEETGALFTGDHVMGWSTSVVAPPDGDMGDYLDSLQKLYEREDRVYYPAHGPAITKPRQLVRGMIGHRRQRERQILRLLEEAPSPLETMVQAMYKGLNPALWGAAGQSTLAHLLDLERRGRVTRSHNLWMIAR